MVEAVPITMQCPAERATLSSRAPIVSALTVPARYSVQ